MEEHCLRIAVPVETSVIIEVIVGKVGKDSYIKGDPFNPVLVKRMGRNLHDRVIRSSGNHVIEEGLQFNRPGGRILRFERPPSVPVGDGADDTGVLSSGIENRFDEVGHRCFSVCPCNTGNVELFRRIVVKPGGDLAHGEGHVRNHYNSRKGLGDVSI